MATQEPEIPPSAADESADPLAATLIEELYQGVDQRIAEALAPLRDEVAALRQRLDTLEQTQGLT